MSRLHRLAIAAVATAGLASFSQNAVAGGAIGATVKLKSVTATQGGFDWDYRVTNTGPLFLVKAFELPEVAAGDLAPFGSGPVLPSGWAFSEVTSSPALGGATFKSAALTPGAYIDLTTTSALGRVDGFDQDKHEDQCDDRGEVLSGLLASQRDPFEALGLADQVLDPGA
jgi:hypothetical protein